MTLCNQAILGRYFLVRVNFMHTQRPFVLRFSQVIDKYNLWIHNYDTLDVIHHGDSLNSLMLKHGSVKLLFGMGEVGGNKKEKKTEKKKIERRKRQTKKGKNAKVDADPSSCRTVRGL